MSSFEAPPAYHLVGNNAVGRNTFWNWCGKMKLSRIIFLLIVFLLLVPLITHYFLLKVDSKNSNRANRYNKLESDDFDIYNAFKPSDLKQRIDEMLRIKGSVSSELRVLESRKQQLQMDVVEYGNKIKTLKQELQRQQAEMERLKISLEQAQWAQQEAALRNTPELKLPKPLLPWSIPEAISPPHSQSSPCRMFTCFDHSRCSLTSGLPVYLYDPDIYTVVTKDYDVDGFLKTTIKQTLGYNAHLTQEPKEACLYLVLVGEAFKNPTEFENNRYRNEIKYYNQSETESSLDIDLLYKLPYWGADGRNHILLNFARRDLSIGSGNVFRNYNTGRAIIVQSTYTTQKFRPGFDLVITPLLGPPGGDVWQECSPILPARRKYLLSFQGELKPVKSNTQTFVPGSRDDETFPSEENEGIVDTFAVDNFILKHLSDITDGTTSDKFFFQFECIPATEQKTIVPIKDWSLCGTDSSRRNILKDSTFVLIFAPGNIEYISTTLLQARLYEALRSGAIPVILGGDQIILPFSEFINWKKCVLLVPKVRVTELHFLLRAIPDADLLSMRRQGRMIWERYLSSVQVTVDTIIAVIRNRLGIPAKPISSVPSISVFNSSFTPIKIAPVESDPENKESLGPLEPPYPSPSFKRNYTVMLTQEYEMWNVWGDPFNLYPQIPFDPVLPSDAKFIGSNLGFRPIGKGAGGAGKEFCESLGGNHPREQFTIVILTYEREQILISSLNRLDGLPYLNKVIVVWNSPKPPLEDLRWPDIGVPIHLVKTTRNSLNNRFLPFDAIETEAVLSVDDDTAIRQDEIIFGFRVWREHRDRVVGFPGRFHAWDLNYNNGWLYNTNYSCELSMVLTGAAFVHKYYLFMYWNWMPQAIRDMVDEYMNCEDIAMNFLVSHLTREPPVKVTSRWTFRCPGCLDSLSESNSHFQERHKCINFFTRVFGYMPLLNTQYRADSILFKTRIPHDKQKCFKFI